MTWLEEALIARGMDPAIAKAFALNGMDESGLKTDINEIAPIVPGSRGGYGVMQWTGPRRRALEAFASERGVAASDPNLQADFLMMELQGPERAAWSKISAAGGTPEAAAAIVNYFLRPAEEHRSRRERKYLGGADLPSGMTMNALGAPQPQAQPANTLAMQEPPRPQIAMNLLDPRAFMTAARMT